MILKSIIQELIANYESRIRTIYAIIEEDKEHESSDFRQGKINAYQVAISDLKEFL